MELPQTLHGGANHRPRWGCSLPSTMHPVRAPFSSNSNDYAGSLLRGVISHIWCHNDLKSRISQVNPTLAGADWIEKLVPPIQTGICG